MQRLAALDRLLPSLDRAGALLLERPAAAELRRMAGAMGEARTTADLRAAADVAVDQQRALRRTARAAPTVEPLVRCADAVDALAGLQELSPEDVSAWAQVRPVLETSLGDEAALAHADALVLQAEEAGARWRADVDAARAARDRDAAALAGHASGVRGLTSPWGQLDAELGPLLDALVLRPAAPADQAQLAGISARYDAVAAALSSAAAPGGVAAEHLALAQAATADAAAVRALADGLASSLGSPPEQARPLLDVLGQQRAATVAARAAAMVAWESAVSRAGTLVATRPLPEPPLV